MVEELLQVATQTGVSGERKMHQKLGHLVITGFDGCWNLELLIQNVLRVRGHGIGCAGDTKCASKEPFLK